MTLLSLFISPVGPSLLLVVGAILSLIMGRWLRRPEWLAALALLFTGMAGWLLLYLRSQVAVVPSFLKAIASS